MVKIPIVLLVAFTVSRVNGQDLATLLVGLTSGGGNGACPKGFSTPTTATSRSAESPYLYDLIMRSFAARQAAVSTPCFKEVPGKSDFVTAFRHCYDETTKATVVRVANLKNLPTNKPMLVRVNAIKDKSGWKEFTADKKGGSSNNINFDGFNFNAFSGKPLDTLIYITHPNFKSKLFLMKHTDSQLKINSRSTFDLHTHCEAPSGNGGLLVANNPILPAAVTPTTDPLLAALGQIGSTFPNLG